MGSNGEEAEITRYQVNGFFILLFLEFWLVKTNRDFWLAHRVNYPESKLRLDEFLGDQSANTVNIDGTAVELPSAPKAATLEIDVTKVLKYKKNILN